jgi:hypothetical protein
MLVRPATFSGRPVISSFLKLGKTGSQDQFAVWIISFLHKEFIYPAIPATLEF